mmetsp:Transcript_26862/g.75293  ORF Transcript_26862/g.75293 Transcript_26862/m.75293 type:complete len:911 (-) Transcript_26862:591-3323(-)
MVHSDLTDNRVLEVHAADGENLAGEGSADVDRALNEPGMQASLIKAPYAKRGYLAKGRKKTEDPVLFQSSNSLEKADQPLSAEQEPLAAGPSPNRRLSWAHAPGQAAEANADSAPAVHRGRRRVSIPGLGRRSLQANAQEDEVRAGATQPPSKRISFLRSGRSRRTSMSRGGENDTRHKAGPSPTRRLSTFIPGFSRRASALIVNQEDTSGSPSAGMTLDTLLGDADEEAKAASPPKRLSFSVFASAFSRHASQDAVEEKFDSLDKICDPSGDGKARRSIAVDGPARPPRTSLDSTMGGKPRRTSWLLGFGKRLSQAFSEEGGAPSSRESSSPTKRKSAFRWLSHGAEAASSTRLSQGGRRLSQAKYESAEELPAMKETKREEETDERRNLARARWRFLRSTIVIGLRLIALLYDTRATWVAAAYTSKMPKNVVLEVKTEKQLKKLCLTLQGNEDLYHEEVLRQRLQLRHDPAVLEPLHEWWATAQRSVQQSASRSDACELIKREYIRIMVLVGKAMLRDFFEVEARHEAEKDWAEDAKSPTAKTIGREQFMDAIFQLADHWTHGVSAEEYTSFLWRLLKRIAISDEGKGGLFWRHLSEVRYMHPHARPTSGSKTTLSRPAPSSHPPKWNAGGARMGEFGAPPPLANRRGSMDTVKKIKSSDHFVHRGAKQAAERKDSAISSQGSTQPLLRDASPTLPPLKQAANSPVLTKPAPARMPPMNRAGAHPPSSPVNATWPPGSTSPLTPQGGRAPRSPTVLTANRAVVMPLTAPLTAANGGLATQAKAPPTLLARAGGLLTSPTRRPSAGKASPASPSMPVVKGALPSGTASPLSSAPFPARSPKGGPDVAEGWGLRGSTMTITALPSSASKSSLHKKASLGVSLPIGAAGFDKSALEKFNPVMRKQQGGISA